MDMDMENINLQLQHINQSIQGLRDELLAETRSVRDQVDSLSDQFQVFRDEVGQFMGIQRFTVQQRNRIFRNMNQKASLFEPLNILMNDDGKIPENFPVTKSALSNIGNAQLNYLLQFYGIGLQGNQATRLRKLCAHLGA